MVNTHDITFRGKTLELYVGNGKNQVRIEYVENNNTYKIIRKSLVESPQQKTFNVFYYTSIEDIEGNVLNTIDDKVTEKDSLKYDQYYNASSDTITIGELLNRSMMNLILLKEFGTIGYNPFKNYEIIQPITFDLSETTGITASTITATIVDQPSGHTLEYSIDGENWQSGNTFEVSESGTYTVSVRSQTDLYVFTETIDITII